MTDQDLDSAYDAHAAYDVTDSTSFPWPPQEGEPVLGAWGRTWHGAAREPRRFFSTIPSDAPLGPALLYYLLIGIAVAGATLFWSMIRDVDPDHATTGTVLGMTGAWTPLLEFLLSPLILLFSIFVAAGVTHLLLRVLGGATGDYGLTTRVFAFAYSPQILGVIPVIGSIVGFIWMVVIAVIGLREAHRTTSGRAAAAVLIPLAIGVAFVMLAELLIRAGGLLDLPA